MVEKQMFVRVCEKEHNISMRPLRGRERKICFHGKYSGGLFIGLDISFNMSNIQ